MNTENFSFQAKLIKWFGDKGAWFFITLPVELSRDIDNLFSDQKRGWGSLPVIVKLGKSQWQTSIFPDKKSACYLLPVKAQIRKEEKIDSGDNVTIELSITRLI